MDLSTNVAGTGLSIKRVAVLGIAGGLTIGISDYWVDQWWEDETDEKSQARYRAAAQAALGLGAAYVLKRWNRDAAIGAAVGGVVGAAVRVWNSENMSDTLDRWFGDDDDTASDTPAQQGERRVNGPFVERTVFTSPRERANVKG